MPRKVPASAKQKKESLQEKRAVKRGDLPPLEPARPDVRRRARMPKGRSVVLSPSADPEVEAARKLQSAFVKVSSAFLEETKILASTVPLPRPLPPQAARFPDDLLEQIEEGFRTSDALSCPRRPKWRFDMSKNEVEKNEEGVFTKWLLQMDGIVDRWRLPAPPPPPDGESAADADGVISPVEEPKPIVPRAPMHFERNLEVWRQLWRVTEISQILLVLLDSRCPLLHFPPSLAAYLSATGCKVILVLTKVDIAGPARTDAWEAYLRTHHADVRIVRVESYVPREESANKQGSRIAYAPHLPLPFREQLVKTIREVHRELLEPPDRIKANEEKVKKWKPRVRKEVNWDAVLHARGGQVGSAVGGAAAPRPTGDEEGELEGENNAEPEFLTIGLIGQPNVGKSSLLNALFGTHKVRTSRTPGKTKHFQTLFWTPEVRLVDCPGLVMPNFIPMEMQVLSGILPISRVSAVPACIHYAARLLPIERILKLAHPATQLAEPADKRTWRDGQRPEARKTKDISWTGMDILTAYADAKGWLTAKAGRQDINRAGNAILRALAEGKVRWAFWPPGMELGVEADDLGHGIWIEGEHSGLTDEESEDEEADEAGKDVKHTESSDEGDDEDEVDDDESESDKGLSDARLATGAGRFGALALDNPESEEDDDDDDDDGSHEDKS